jgi:hypothetical protein
LNIETKHAMWVAYLTVRDFGTGAAINLPYTAVSAVLNEEDMVTGNGESTNHTPISIKALDSNNYGSITPVCRPTR